MSSSSSSSLLRRSAAGLLLGVLASGGLVATAGAPSTAAAAVNVEEADLSASIGSIDDDNFDCTVAATRPADTHLAWSDNAVPVTTSTNVAATSTAPTGEVADITAASTATIKATPLSAPSSKITLTGSATAKVVSRTATNPCFAYTDAEVTAGAFITLPAARWATIDIQTTGKGKAALNIDGVVAVRTGTQGTGSARTYLPAGNYLLDAGFATGEANLGGAKSGTTVERSIRGTVSVSFEEPGTAFPTTGKGRDLVKLRGRDCAANLIGATITRLGDKRAKTVTFAINGKRTLVLKGKRVRPRTVALKVGATTPATVTSTVKLKNGKTLVSKRRYLACS